MPHSYNPSNRVPHHSTQSEWVSERLFWKFICAMLLSMQLTYHFTGCRLSIISVTRFTSTTVTTSILTICTWWKWWGAEDRKKNTHRSEQNVTTKWVNGMRMKRSNQKERERGRAKEGWHRENKMQNEEPGVYVCCLQIFSAHIAQCSISSFFWYCLSDNMHLSEWFVRRYHKSLKLFTTSSTHNFCISNNFYFHFFSAGFFSFSRFIFGP